MKKNDKQLFKNMKVFDCQDMPDELRRMFFSLFDKGNDSCVKWQINDSVWKEDEGKECKAIDKWLVENGAQGPSNVNRVGEEVIILYWW